MCLGWQHNNQGSLTTNNQQSQPIPSGCLRTSSARDLYPEDPIFSPDPILHRGSRKTSFYFGHFKFSLRNKNLDPWQFYVFVDLSTSSSLNNLSDSPLNNLSTGASLRSSSMAKASFICGADSPVRLASLATALVREDAVIGRWHLLIKTTDLWPHRESSHNRRERCLVPPATCPSTMFNASSFPQMPKVSASPGVLDMENL